MPKGRRERDRPKARPEAAFNPHKRILLSYDSDDAPEEVDPVPSTGHPAAVSETTADYQIAEYPDEEYEPPEAIEETLDKSPTNAEEDAHTYVNDADATPSAIIPAGERSSALSRGVRRNDATGQWPALGSLSYQQDDHEDEDDEAYDGAEDEAIAYLRAVRSERQTLPTVFVAPRQELDDELYKSGVGDSRGHYSEGTYIGRPVDFASEDSEEVAIEPQEAYTMSLVQRFLKQREELHRPAGENAVARLSRQHLTRFRNGDNKTYAQWVRIMSLVAPLPAQIRSMDQKSVTGLLQLIQRMYLSRSEDIKPVTSSWIWSLLARLDDVGTMDNDQVFFLREFGKKAVLVQYSFEDPAGARHLEGIGAESSKTTPSASISALQATQQHESVDENTSSGADDDEKRQNSLATLDMIITVIAKAFGQRDLLDVRRCWNTTKEDGEPASY